MAPVSEDDRAMTTMARGFVATWLASVITASIFAAPPDEDFRRFYGPRFQPSHTITRNRGPQRQLDAVHRWNEIAINATGLDHTPVSPGENRIFGQQLGPTRASRAMAIIHIAIFDSVNAIVGGCDGYTNVRAPRGPVSLEAAVAQAAHDTLSSLYSSQAPAFDAWLAEDLAAIHNNQARVNGVTLGHTAAAAILAQRLNDGSATPEPHFGVDYFASNLPGQWREDPVSQIPTALGAHWSAVAPFVLQSTSQFRIPPPPALASSEYTTAYLEAKRLGGDGVVTPTDRTAAQTFIGVFWAYDGTPSLCAPPRLYNQVAVQIADHRHLDVAEFARMLALVNVAMGDTAMAVWESKYHYTFWRPVTGIRESDPGTGPTGAGDGNPATPGDAGFMPLGAPASNLTGPNFTPPFPSYPSGHAGFGGALFQILRRFYGTDHVPFTFVSDEFDGITKGNDGNVRPYLPRFFSTLSQAEEENGQSRIYLGIHWRFDKTEGITQGQHVADYVFDHAFRSRRH
jgi:PAP2 superfamily